MVSRILYVGPADITVPSGPGVNEYEFIVAASQVDGIEWRFVVPDPAGDWPQDIARDQCRHYSRWLGGARPLSWLLSQRAALTSLEHEIRHFRPDLIVARPGLLPLGIATAVANAPAPYVLRHCSDGTLAEFDRLPLIGGWLRAWNRRLLCRLTDRAQIVELMSPIKLQRFRANFPAAAEKAVLVHNGVNTDRFRPVDRVEARISLAIRHSGPIMGYVGNHPWRRGGRLLIEAARILREVGEPVFTIILGDNGDRARLTDLAARLGLSDCVMIPGRVPFQSVNQYIGACDVCVSLLEEREMHASPQKVLQYLACGRPAVVNHPDAAFVVDAGIGSFVHGDAAAVADTLRPWLHLPRDNAQSVEIEARSYALDKLSYAGRLRERVAAWETSAREYSKRSRRADRRSCRLSVGTRTKTGRIEVT